MNRGELEAHVARLAAEPPGAAAMAEEVDKKVAALAHASPHPRADLLHVERGGERRAFAVDDSAGVRELLLDVYGTALRDASEHEPELLLPLPAVVEVEAAQLLAPFPVGVEAPTLSPAFAAKELLTAILDRVGTADPNELKVS